MALDNNSLYLQKEGGQIVDTLGVFGIHTGEDIAPFEPSEVKVDGNSFDFPDESGLDVYNAKEVNYKAYDIEIPLVITGDTPTICRDKGAALSAYLTGHDGGRYGEGTLFAIYHPWLEMGAAMCRFKSTKDNKFSRDECGNVFMTRTLVLECCKPEVGIMISKDEQDLVEYGNTSSEV